MKLDVDVKGYKATIQRIRNGIHQGMKDTTDELLDDAEEDAKDVLSETRRIWRREVYHGFEKTRTSHKTGASGRIANMAPHATVVERGADYGVVGPPVEALIPWVVSHWGTGGVGGDDTDDGPDYDNDVSSGTSIDNSDIDDSKFPSDTVGGTENTAKDLAQYGAEPDWVFHYNDVGYNREQVFVDQEVVLWNNQKGEYIGGVVRNIPEPGIVEVGTYDPVRFGEATIDDKYGRSDWAIVAGEDFDKLSDSRIAEVLDKGFDRIDRSSNLNDFNKETINHVIGEYRELIDDPRMLLNLSKELKEFGAARKDRTNSNNPAVLDEAYGSIIYLRNPQKSNPKDREDHATYASARHEFAHALTKANGWDGHGASRSTSPSHPEDWDAVKYWSNNSSDLPFNYVDQGGPGNFHLDTSKVNDSAHPVVYMITHQDDKIDPLKVPNYSAYQKWTEYIYRSVLVQNDADEYREVTFPDTPRKRDNVMDPDGGILEKGGVIKAEYTDGQGNSTEIELWAESEVREFTDDEVDKDLDSPVTAIRLYSPADDATKLKAVNDDNTLAQDSLSFTNYLKPSEVTKVEWELDESDVPNNPGFENPDDSFGLFMEGVNRAFFRQVLTAEITDGRHSEGIFIGRSYNATNAQETLAAFMPIWMAEPGGAETQLRKAEDLFENHPDLLYAAIQYFGGAPEDLKDRLTFDTGLDWTTILMQIDPNFDQP